MTEACSPKTPAYNEMHLEPILVWQKGNTARSLSRNLWKPMLWSVTTIDAMNLTWTRRLLFVIAQAAAMLAAMETGAAEIAVDLQAPVPKYVGVYTQPPNTVGSLDPSIHAYRIPDGPLMGNGDIAVAVGGTATEQTFYLSKSDLSHSARGVGGLTISFKDATADDLPAEGSKYRQEQDLYKAEVRSVIPLRQATVKMRSWTADGDNVLVTEMLDRAGGTGRNPSSLVVAHGPLNESSGAENGVIWLTREMNATIGTTKQPFVSKVAVATRIMGIKPECSTNGKAISSYNRRLARSLLPAGGQNGADRHRRRRRVQRGEACREGQGVRGSVTARKLDDLHAVHREWWKTRLPWPTSWAACWHSACRASPTSTTITSISAICRWRNSPGRTSTIRG